VQEDQVNYTDIVGKGRKRTVCFDSQLGWQWYTLDMASVYWQGCL